MGLEMTFVERPCVDCGEPTCNAERCRECDLEYIVASGSCRECLTWITDPPRARQIFASVPEVPDQHKPGCSLRDSEDYAPRTDDELRAVREGRAT